jgi:DNA-binding LacI/PurR family transcriptional regulator
VSETQFARVAAPRSPRLAPLVKDVSRAITSAELIAGERLPPLRKLAEKYGISFSTARAAVAYLEKAGYVERCHGSGVYVRHLAPRNESSEPVRLGAWVAIVVHLRPHIFDNLTSRLIERLTAGGLVPLEMPADGPDQAMEELIDRWRQNPPRAVVVQRYTNPKLIGMIRSVCPPSTRIVQFFRDPSAAILGWHSVEPNLPAAYQMAADYLVAKGHRRIGVLVKSRKMSPPRLHTQRKAWMMHTPAIIAAGRALRAAGAHLMIHANLPVNSDPAGIPIDEANVARTAEWLTGPNRPTAVIGEDFRILGVKRAAHRAGLRVPEDLPVVGIGGTAIAEAGEFPSVSLRYDLVGDRLAELILTTESDLGGVDHHVVVPPQFDPT